MSMVESIPRTPNRRMNTEKKQDSWPLNWSWHLPSLFRISFNTATMSASLTHSSISVTCRSLSVFADEPTKAMCVGLS